MGIIENLIFSVNAVLPVFVVMATGYFLKRRGMLDKATASVLNTLVFKLGMPALLFVDVYSSNLRESFDIRLILLVVVGTITSFFIIWGGAVLLIKDKQSIGSFVQGSFRSNFAIVGVSFAMAILGSRYTGKSAIVLSFLVPTYNILSIIVLTCYRKREGKLNNIFKTFIIEISRNPLILGILLGGICSLSGIKLPSAVINSLGYFKSLTTPVALLVLGSSISFENLRGKLRLGLAASFIKLVGQSVIFVLLAIWLRLDVESVIITFVAFGAPTAIASYIMSAEYHNDAELAANIVLISTLASSFTITLGVFMLKTLGIL